MGPAVRIEVGCLRRLYRIRTEDRQNRVLPDSLSPLAFEILSQKSRQARDGLPEGRVVRPAPSDAKPDWAPSVWAR
jgi:hypothetical protein